jgi:hypothetical protein
MQKSRIGIFSFWIDIAEKAGLIIKPPSDCDERLKSHQDGQHALTMVNKNIDPRKVFYTRLKTGMQEFYASQMDRQALLTAIAGRIKFFETNMKRGVFKSSEAIAKKYPGIKVSS